jgi:hypothetical protein
VDIACRLISARVLLRLQRGCSHGRASFRLPPCAARYNENKATKGDLLTGAEECASRPGRYEVERGDPARLFRPLRDMPNITSTL